MAGEKIDSSISDSVLPISALRFRPDNARRGHIEGIKAILTTLGQLSAINVRERAQEPGTYLVLTGNHRAQAAKELGWEFIAVNEPQDIDDDEAIEHAITDNRISEMGYTDPEADVAQARLALANTKNSHLLEALGYDDKGIQAMQEAIAFEVPHWEPPDPRPQYEEDLAGGYDRPNIEGNDELPKQAHRMVFQLVFDTQESQREWSRLFDWLVRESGYQGTPTEKLLAFMGDHASTGTAS